MRARRDFALRLALGASRRGIVGQCIVEALLLAGAAAVAGTGVAWVSRDALRAAAPVRHAIPRPCSICRSMAASSRRRPACRWSCALAFALLPALQASRIDLASAFQGGTRTLRGRRRSWVVRGLLAVQVALSLVLLVSAGLFARTLPRLDAFDAGFDQRGLLLFRIDATSAATPPIAWSRCTIGSASSSPGCPVCGR